jgi:hypothetical protein
MLVGAQRWSYGVQACITSTRIELQWRRSTWQLGIHHKPLCPRVAGAWPQGRMGACTVEGHHPTHSTVLLQRHTAAMAMGLRSIQLVAMGLRLHGRLCMAALPPWRKVPWPHRAMATGD